MNIRVLITCLLTFSLVSFSTKKAQSYTLDIKSKRIVEHKILKKKLNAFLASPKNTTFKFIVVGKDRVTLPFTLKKQGGHIFIYTHSNEMLKIKSDSVGADRMIRFVVSISLDMRGLGEDDPVDKPEGSREGSDDGQAVDCGFGE